MTQLQPQHRKLYNQALQSFRTETGTPYPCLQTEIDFHTLRSFPHRNKEPFVSTLEATNEMLWQNNSRRTVPPAEKAAIARLQSVFLSGYQNIGPDVAIKAFLDLDCVFFGGKLRGNVTVAWADSETDMRFLPVLSECRIPVLGFTDGRTDRLLRERGQSRIVLNARVLLGAPGGEEPMQTQLATLLHEMVHCFQYIRCSLGLWKIEWGRKRGFEYDDCHDDHFGSRISVVDVRAMKLLGLNAVHRAEPYRCHHFLGELSERKVEGCEGNLLKRSARAHRGLG